MKTMLTLVLFCFLLSEAFQVSEALQCYKCEGQTCNSSVEECFSGADRCQTTKVDVLGQKGIMKGCSTKAVCDLAASTGLMTCCESNLCNGAEGFKLSFFIILGPLLFSILFL